MLTSLMIGSFQATDLPVSPRLALCLIVDACLPRGGRLPATDAPGPALQESYESHQHEFNEEKQRGRSVSLAVSFAIWELASSTRSMTEASFVEFVTRVQVHGRDAQQLKEVHSAKTCAFCALKQSTLPFVEKCFMPRSACRALSFQPFAGCADRQAFVGLHVRTDGRERRRRSGSKRVYQLLRCHHGDNRRAEGTSVTLEYARGPLGVRTRNG